MGSFPSKKFRIESPSITHGDRPVPPPAKFLILGDAGSGKSTVMRILGKLPLDPEEGKRVDRTLEALAGRVKLSWATATETERRKLPYAIRRVFEYFAADPARRERAIAGQATREDLLHLYSPTSGIIESTLGVPLSAQLIDVGGARSERRKWIHTFDGVDSFIFCASLLALDTSVDRRNRATDHSQESTDVPGDDLRSDSTSLWNDISGSNWFRHAPRVLVFTHFDELETELRKRPFAEYWRNCPPTIRAPKACAQWLADLFLTNRPCPVIFSGIRHERQEELLRAALHNTHKDPCPKFQWVTVQPVWPVLRIFLVAVRKQKGDSDCPAASLPTDLYRYMMPFLADVMKPHLLVSDETIANPARPRLQPLRLREPIRHMD